MTLFLLCAGEGTRFRPHTLRLPKPALPFLGVPLAAYSLEWARELSPQKLVVNTYHLPTEIHRLFQTLPHGFNNLHFSDEQPHLMGSGGALAKAQSLLSEHEEILVMNGDEVFLSQQEGLLKEALFRHRQENRLATLIVMEHPEVGKQFGGVWTNAEGHVLGFGKIPIAGAQKGWHFIGAALYSRRLLARLSPNVASNILYDDLTQAIADGERVATHVVQGWWHETGNETDYLRATSACLQILGEKRKEAQLLEKVLQHYCPGWQLEKTDSSWSLRHQGSVVSSECELTGFCVIGANAEITGHCRIEDSVIADSARLHGQNLKRSFFLP